MSKKKNKHVCRVLLNRNSLGSRDEQIEHHVCRGLVSICRCVLNLIVATSVTHGLSGTTNTSTGHPHLCQPNVRHAYNEHTYTYKDFDTRTKNLSPIHTYTNRPWNRSLSYDGYHDGSMHGPITDPSNDRYSRTDRISRSGLGANVGTNTTTVHMCCTVVSPCRRQCENPTH